MDAPNRELLLILRTGAKTAGHPRWTHGGFTSLLMDEMAGQAYAEFVQPTRGIGMTANLTVNFASPLPTDSDLLVVAGVERTEGRKVWLRVEVRDGPRRACEVDGRAARGANVEDDDAGGGRRERGDVVRVGERAVHRPREGLIIRSIERFDRGRAPTR